MFVKIVRTKGSDLEPIRRIYRWKSLEDELAARRMAEEELARRMAANQAAIDEVREKAARLREEIDAAGA